MEPSDLESLPRLGVVLARLRHVLSAIGCLQGISPASRFVLGPQEGEGEHVFHDGQGNFYAAAWAPDGFVALAFDHTTSIDNEFALAPAERTPEQRFTRMPAELTALRDRVIGLTERLGTGAVWSCVDPSSGQTRRWDSPVDDALLAPLSGALDETLFGEGGWLQAHAVSQAHGELALDLASGAAPRLLTGAESATLLSPTTAHDPVLELKDVEAAAGMLADLGYGWPSARADAETHNAALLARRAASDTDRGLALLEAVHAGDEAAVAGLLDQGANLDKVSPPGLFRRGGGDETPLVVAIRTARSEITSTLIERGANVNPELSGRSPLGWAAQRGDADLCRLLLARGAKPSLGGGRAILTNPSQCGASVEVLRVLIDADVPLPAPNRRAVLAMFAEEHGAADLAARIGGSDQAGGARELLTRGSAPRR